MGSKLNSFYTRFSNDKKLRRLIITIAAIGIALLALSEFVDFSGGKNGKSNKSLSGEAYRQDLEHRITQLISEVEGVGKAKVMINLSEDISVGAQSGAGTQENRQVKGVLVICEGGDNAKVVAKLTQAVSVALNVDYNKIYITKMQSNFIAGEN